MTCFGTIDPQDASCQFAKSFSAQSRDSRKPLCIAGIDPGLSGAIAFYFPSAPTRVSVQDMPTVEHRVDGATLATMFEQLRPDLAVIELVGAMPGQGVTSMFNFGLAFGTAIGVIQGLRIPYRFVTPAKWKKRMDLGKDKEVSRARALATFTDVPEHFARKKDDGRAEAALLALYGSMAFLADREAA